MRQRGRYPNPTNLAGSLYFFQYFNQLSFFCLLYRRVVQLQQVDIIRIVGRESYGNILTNVDWLPNETSVFYNT